MTGKHFRAEWMAACIALALLSPHVQAADAEPAKAPLTAEERQQCLAQLTEINQAVTAHNQRVQAIKALESEVDTLRVERDKEEAGLDRRDKAVMEAFNAKVQKNNELVARYEKMVAEAKAAAAENKQRVAQFRSACDNRPAAPPAQASSAAAAACGSAAGYKDVQRSIEATFAEMRADEKARQDEVERAAQARAKEVGWSKDKQAKVWLQILGSAKFMAFEREKAPYMQQLMGVMGSKPKNSQEECQLVQRIAATLPAIKAINTRQYAFMAEQIRVAK